MPRKKPFIDKKHATTYRLVPGFVPDTIEEDNILVTDEGRDRRKEDQRKYGVFYEDDYDYMQHLRSLTEGATMVKVTDLNSVDDEVRSSYGGSVDFKMFTSEFGKKDHSTQNIDPDILASLDDAPEVKLNEDGEMEVDASEDFLDDDFIGKAGGYELKPERDDRNSSSTFFMEDQDLGSDFDENSDNDFYDDDDDLDDEFEDRLGTQQSKGRGNTQDDIIEAQTALILKNFEEGLGFSCVAQQIDDDDGRATTEDIANLKEIIIQDKLKENKVQTCNEYLDDHESRPCIDTSKYDYDEEEEFVWKEVPPSKPKFDCVSILSLNSNTRNLPTDIIPPSSRKKRSNCPSESEMEPSGDRGLSQRELDEEMRLSRKADKASTFRPKDETLEEKKNRKKILKEERKDRRQEKKANKIVFSMEKQQMEKEVASLSKAGKGIMLT